MALMMDMLVAKSGPIRDDGNSSVMTDLRRNQNKGGGAVLIRARDEEEQVRMCEQNNMETPRLLLFPVRSSFHTRQLHIFYKLVEDALDLIVCVIDKDVKEHQDRALRDTTHHSLHLDIKPLIAMSGCVHPINSLSTQQFTLQICVSPTRMSCGTILNMLQNSR
ncbi:hypothetical protein TURU_106443 [Turdus rufiventris]|nr:hypothetical protein TURU_106443 [Turdus rufiventris]